MPKTKTQKQTIVQSIAEYIDRQKAMVFVDYKGMGVKELSALRSQLKQAQGRLVVMKKTLFQKALKEKGIALNVKNLVGQVAAIFALDDPVAPIKSASIFAKTHDKLNILGGYFEHSEQSKETMTAIASLPSRQELLGRLVGTIASPVSGFVSVLQGNIKGLLAVLSAKSRNT